MDNNYVDDDRPAHMEPRGFLDKLKETHRRFNEKRKRDRTGTLAGLEDLIRRRKMEGSHAEQDS